MRERDRMREKETEGDGEREIDRMREKETDRMREGVRIKE